MVSDTVIVEGGPAKGAPPTPTTLLARLDRLPDAPGVYLMKGKRGETLYVGKANVLTDRVRSYFKKGAVPAGALRETLGAIKEIFPLATCTIEIDGKAERPCIEYEIKRCMAPCVGYQTSQEYHEIVKQARMFLEGRDTELLETYRGQMEAAAEREDFEAAGRIRDRIFKIDRALERQRVAQTENVDQA